MIILEDYPGVKLSFHELLAQRTFNKTAAINQIKSQKSEHLIKLFFGKLQKTKLALLFRKISYPEYPKRNSQFDQSLCRNSNSSTFRS